MNTVKLFPRVVRSFVQHIAAPPEEVEGEVKRIRVWAAGMKKGG
jgi:hypothetical protein